MRHSLLAAFDEADKDTMRAVIVTGGARLGAGADLSKGEETFNYEKRANCGPTVSTGTVAAW